MGGFFLIGVNSADINKKGYTGFTLNSERLRWLLIVKTKLKFIFCWNKKFWILFEKKSTIYIIQINNPEMSGDRFVLLPFKISNYPKMFKTIA